MGKMRLAIGVLVIWALDGSAASVQFNRDIRPILSDRCFACHGPDPGNRKSKLRLDIEADAKADLGRGRRGIVPGQPEQSEVYKRLTIANKTLRMPPEYLGHDKLPDAQIDLIRRWIDEGAPYQLHWSFIPPRRPEGPAVSDAGWPKNSIDYFILNRLDREQLKPTPEADKRTLLRRVTLDLTGLPPTPEEIRSFLNDSSPGPYEKVVDRLLASPHYAERMAIRWLEAARYADTNGYQSDGPRDMWRWRDWVIDAFHRDMPYDQFTIEQIAGDLLPNATLSQKIATGFNRNHRTSAEGGIVDEEFRVEYVADRTETTATVWLGLTVGCARCHDHKYDPITQKEYYSLFAFFNNVPEKGFVWNFGNEEPVMKAPLPEQQQRWEDLNARIGKAEARLAKLQPKLVKAQQRWERKADVDHTSTCSVETRPDAPELRIPSETDGPKLNYRDPFTFSVWINPESPTGAILSKGEDYFESTQHALYLINGKIRLHVTFRWTDLAMRMETTRPVAMNTWQHIAVTYDGSMKASGVHIYLNGEEQQQNVLFDQLLWPIESKEPWRIGAGGGLRFTGALRNVRILSRAISPAEVAAFSTPDVLAQITRIPAAQRTRAQREKLRLCFEESDPPRSFAKTRAQLTALLKQRELFLETVPTVMVMKDRDQPRETFLLQRGAYDMPGAKVSAAIPAVLPDLNPDFPRNRLGLARWLVDPRNPLTARAAVNRFWAMIFGTGLVKTLEDFGSQGEWPVHPEVLDWLAVDFIDSKWSVKHLIKTMVMSATYRQSSKVTPDLLKRDPENRLLARGARFRLPADALRDQALAVSGLLVDKVGGPPVKPYQPAGLWQELTGGKGYQEDSGEGLYRRSLYTYWRRTVAPPNMTTFDSPTRETCVIRETRTNTPLQALTLMNDVLYVEAARKLAEYMSDKGIAQTFERVLSRPPSAHESSALQSALGKFQIYYQANPADAGKYLDIGKSPRNPRISVPQLAAYTGVASLILNLDEAVTKE